MYKQIKKCTNLCKGRNNTETNAHLINGVVCGYRIEEIEDEFELYRQCRRMKKLIDELARGRKMEKILRKEKI